MRRKKKFYKVESKNPQSEKWFKDHEWKVMKAETVSAPFTMNKPTTNVIQLQCVYCNSEILCLGYMKETETDEKIYIFDIEQEDLTCEELCIRDLIE